MFKPLLQKHDRQPHVDDALPDEPQRAGLPESEQVADAQAAAAQACDDEVAYCVIRMHDDAGGVDASDVLHSVQSVEVHACVESELCPAVSPLLEEAGDVETRTPRRSSTRS